MVFGKKQEQQIQQPSMVIDPNQQQVQQPLALPQIQQPVEPVPVEQPQKVKQHPKALITQGSLLEDGNYRYVVETNYPLAIDSCVIHNEF